MGNSAFFQNRDCEYFPCHETSAPEKFNCLFCFCPLYHLKEACGGDYVYRGGLTDCTGCLYPHMPEHYGEILQRLTPSK